MTETTLAADGTPLWDGYVHDTGEICGTLCHTCNRVITERRRRYVLDPPARRVARRLGLAGLFVPAAVREDKAQRRQRRKTRPAATTPQPAGSYADKVAAALRSSTPPGGQHHG